MLRSSDEIFQIFPGNTVNVTYGRNKTEKAHITFYFPRAIKENNCSIEKCKRRCDICKDFPVISTEFTSANVK